MRTLALLAAGAVVLAVWFAWRGTEHEGRARGVEVRPGAAETASSMRSNSEGAVLAEEREEQPGVVAGPTGRLEFRLLRTEKAARASRWRIRSCDGEGDFVALSDPEVTVPVGCWEVESLDDRYRLLDQAPFHVGVDELRTVWVLESGDAEFTVVDSDGVGISGCVATWAPPGASRSDERAPSWPVVRTAPSDANGVLVFRDLPDRTLGDLRFLADGYFPEERLLRGALPDSLRTVVLRPTGRAARRLSVVELSSGVPLEGVVLSTVWSDDRLGVTDAEGSLPLPTWLDDDVWLHAEGACYPWEFTVPLAVPVRVPASSEGTLIVTGATTAEVAVDVSATGTGGRTPRALEGLELEDGRCTVTVPAGVTFRLDVTDGHGHHGHVEERVSSSGWEAHVMLADEGVLAIEVEHPEGVAASPNYGGEARPSGTYRSGPDGRIRVPFVEEAHSIAIEAENRGTVVLRAHGDERRDGEVFVDLPETRPVTLQLVDALRPVEFVHGRMVVDLDSTAPSNLDEYPDHQGGVPSGHPGWSLARPRVPSVTTDVFGRAEVRLVDGEYVANFTDLPRWRTGSIPWSFHSSSRVSFEVPPDGVVPIPIQGSRFVSLEVRDAETGREVESFDIGPAGHFGRTMDVHYPHLRVEGASWQGWISAAVDAFSIGNARLGFEEVAVPDEDRVELLVDIGDSAVPMTFRLDPSCVDLEGLEVGFVCHRASGGADYQGRSVVNNGILEVLAPAGLSDLVTLQPVQVGGRRILVEPRTMPWAPGSEVEITCSVQ